MANLFMYNDHINKQSCLLKTKETTMTGKKFDAGKPRYDLIPPVVLEQLATVLTFGAEKYGPNNWQAVPDAHNRYYAALMRHVEADRGGEVYDEESNLPHLTHALACVTFMLHGCMVQPEVEQRPGCKVPPKLELFLGWLGSEVATMYLDNVDAEHLKDLAATCLPEMYVASAFVWRKTEEGNAFWSAVNNKWVAHLELKFKRGESEVAPWLVQLVEWLGPINATAFLNNLTRVEEIKHYKQANLLTSAFSWGDTDEGADFWAALDSDWRKHLNSVKGGI
jgi:hypothetical protein